MCWETISILCCKYLDAPFILHYISDRNLKKEMTTLTLTKYKRDFTYRWRLLQFWPFSLEGHRPLSLNLTFLSLMFCHWFVVYHNFSYIYIGSAILAVDSCTSDLVFQPIPLDGSLSQENFTKSISSYNFYIIENWILLSS